MTQQVGNSILDKIQKLLRLQKSAEEIGSLHEAELAAMRVTELLLKYNLELEDVSNHTNPEKTDLRRFDEHGIVNPKNEGKWIHALYNVLCRFNFCKLIVSTRGGLKDYAIIVGTVENVESIKFLADQLENRIRLAEKDAWKHNFSNEKRNAFRRGFFLGAVRGIQEQLTRQREMEARANAKVTALVLARDTKMADFINKEFHQLGKGRSSRVSAANGYSQGLSTGRSISINKGVGSTINNKMIS